MTMLRGRSPTMSTSNNNNEYPQIDAHDFYQEYHGHKVSHLERLLPALRNSSDQLIWLAGDSSLDNKYWFSSRRPAVGVYHNVLHPSWMVTDINYWLNEKLEGRRMAAINTAVEATTLNERTFALRPQDTFLRDHIQQEDILVVSLGGNDVALMPCPCTIASILGLVCCIPEACIKGCTYGTCPLDDCCCGCGASLASCACACPPCLGYLRHLFGTRTQRYIENLTRHKTPHKILVCMIYFPDETLTPSWAAGALGVLGYNSNPHKLQTLIRTMFQEATGNIKIKGAQVIPVPLFHVLDGKAPEDYVARVEPSPIGGEKMARYILHLIDTVPNQQQTMDDQPLTSAASSPPQTSYMDDR